MYFGLSEDQIFFQENVSKFLEDQASLDIIRSITEGDSLELQGEIHSGLVNLGLGSLLIPEEFGGLGLDLLFATAVSQSLGGGIAPIAFTGSYIMAPLAIIFGGNQTQKERYLTQMSKNSIRIGVGLYWFFLGEGENHSKHKLLQSMGASPQHAPMVKDGPPIVWKKCLLVFDMEGERMV